MTILAPSGSTTPRLNWLHEARVNLKLAGPIMLTQSGMMLMGLVDTALAGHVGKHDLAAVALGNTLAFFTSVPALGIFIAIEPLASQAFGAGQPVRARAIYHTSLRLALWLTPLVAALTYASLWLLPLVKVDPLILPGVSKYVLARLPGILPFYIYMAVKTYQQTALRPGAAVEAVILANIVHAILGFLIVFGDQGLARIGVPAMGLPHFGGPGAGLTTSFSACFMALWVSVIRSKPKRKKDLDISVYSQKDSKWKDLLFMFQVSENKIVKTLCRIGIPIGLTFAAEVGIFSLTTLLMGRIGASAAAAHQVALSLASFSFMNALGVAQATSVRVGLFIGQQNFKATRHAGFVGLVLGVLIMGTWAIVFALIPKTLARLFSSEIPVLEIAVRLIQIAAIFQLADGAQVVAAGALRGAGDTRWPLLCGVFGYWCIGLPLAYVFGFYYQLGAQGLWYGLTLSLLFVAIALVSRFAWLSRREIRPISH